MQRLIDILPTLAGEMQRSLRDKGLDQLALTLAAAEVSHWTVSDDPEVGYVYFVQCERNVPGQQKVAKTFQFNEGRWFNLDVSSAGSVLGVELLDHRHELTYLEAYRSN